MTPANIMKVVSMCYSFRSSDDPDVCTNVPPSPETDLPRKHDHLQSNCAPDGRIPTRHIDLYPPPPTSLPRGMRPTENL